LAARDAAKRQLILFLREGCQHAIHFLNQNFLLAIV
jgi:hypothetical protein